MMRTLANGLAALQAEARDAEAAQGQRGARGLATAVAALEAGALAPVMSTAVVGVCLGRVQAAARAYAGASRLDVRVRTECFAVFEAALYRLATAAATARPDEAVLAGCAGYDRSAVPNPIARMA